MLAHKLMGGTAAATTLYVDDVFSAYTYTGNGSTQTITNGIDLAGKDGLVMIKNRNALAPWVVFMTSGYASDISNSAVYGGGAAGYAYTKSNSGFSITDAYTDSNTLGSLYASWTFRKAPKFFDCGTYTGDGVAGRQIAHALGVQLGMLIVKRIGAASDWQVICTGLFSNKYMVLNSTAAPAVGTTRWNNVYPTESVFTLGTDATVNASGGTYVWYAFAHDASSDGIIQCGTFTTDGTGKTTVNIGWEPQYLMVKRINGAGSWSVFDASRGFSYSSPNAIYAESAVVESTSTGAYIVPMVTGFETPTAGWFAASATYSYLAIRRPNKPPTTVTQVFNPRVHIGTGAATNGPSVGFAPDLVAVKDWNAARGSAWYDRLRGNTLELRPYLTNTENLTSDSITSFGQNGVTFGADATARVNFSTAAYTNYYFKRAPGVFDVVCYTGDTNSNRYIAHSLGVAPELVIVKQRGSASQWFVSHQDFGGTTYNAYLNLTNAKGRDYEFSTNDSPHTASAFIVNGGNTNGGTCVAYLFATKAGISKVGSYTGNGGSQTINCGFTTGVRFILIKRTSGTGDWYVWNTEIGITVDNDPYHTLNKVDAGVYGSAAMDSIDQETTGFIVNQVTSTNINVTSDTYIYLAFA